MARMIVTEKDVENLRIGAAAAPPPTAAPPGGPPTAALPGGPPPPPPAGAPAAPGAPAPPAGQGPVKAVQADDFKTRLVKYIPSEVLGVYIAIDAGLKAIEGHPSSLDWALFAFGLLCTYLYLWRMQNVTKQLQLFVSCGAFAVWVFTLGGPFAPLGWYQPAYGTLLLPAYMFLAGLLEA